MEKSLILLCYLLPAVPVPLMLLSGTFLQSFLLADSQAVRDDSICLEKFIENFY